MRLLKWFTARLAGPRAGYAVIALALVLALPALFSPLAADDYIHARKLREAFAQPGLSAIGSVLADFFRFYTGDVADNWRKVDQGPMGWWSVPDRKLAFFRPIATATHLLDYVLWRGNAVMMHLHTLLWFTALLFAVKALCRRLLTPGLATLALALYAWDDARGFVLAFVANRSALIAGLFAICCLIAHDRWRRDGWRPGAWVAPLLLGMALLSSEMALATTGFLFAHALYLDAGSLWRRLSRLGSYLLVVVVWQTCYLAGGYGVHGSGFYQHPLHDPWAYVVKLVERAPVLALAELTPFPSDTWMLYSPTSKAGLFVLAVAVLAVIGRTAWSRLRDGPSGRFFIVGAGLSLLPIAATAPQDRNLVFVGFGVAPALAILFGHWVDEPPAARWPRFVLGTLAVFNLALAPLTLPAKCLSMVATKHMFASTDACVPRNSAIKDKTLVVVWVWSEAALGFSLPQRDAEGLPRPRKTRILALSRDNVTVTRRDEFTLRLRPDDGFLPREMDRLSRGPSQPLHPGDVVRLSDMTATVDEVVDGWRPQTVTFRFSAPLESPHLLWMRGDGMRLVGWTPPEVGETVVVPALL